MSKKFDLNVDDAVKEYADMVYRLSLLNTSNVQDAEDVFQEVFFKLFKYKDTIVSDEHLKAWLIRVTINQCKGKALLTWNKKTVLVDNIPERAVRTADKDYSEVYEAVKNLPQKYRRVIYLYYYEEFKISEIAKLLKKNEATIKTQLSRGKKLLNETLKGEFGNDR